MDAQLSCLSTCTHGFKQTSDGVVAVTCFCCGCFQMLCSGNQALTRVAAGILCDLSQDPEGVLLIEQADASTPLTTLLSKNEDEGVGKVIHK